MIRWPEIKSAIQADLLARSLKAPQLRLNALDRLEKLLTELWTDFPSNPKILESLDKDTVSTKLAALKKNGKLNGAEKSVLSEILKRLGAAPLNPSVSKLSAAHHAPANAITHRPFESARGDTTSVKRGLSPVIGKDSRILILGTMPGDESLRLQQYYAHRNNQFWRILGEVYGEPVAADYSKRLEFLHRKGLALWDVLRSADRAGSLDSGIRNSIANNFADLLMNYANLKVIVFNGGRAQALFRRNVEGSQSSVAGSSMRKVLMPSTSPTPGRNVLKFEEKVEHWRSLADL